MLAVYHIWQRELAAVENACYVNGHHAAPVVFGYVCKKFLLGNAGVVYKHIYAACGTEHIFCLCTVGNVRTENFGARFRKTAVYSVAQAHGRFFRMEEVEDDEKAVTAQPFCYGAAYPPCGAGDKSLLQSRPPFQ
jgi:hypothetical protein